KKPEKTQGLQSSQVQAKIRLLLALWDMGGAQKEVKKGELTRRVQRTGEKAGDYQSIYEHLEQSGAIVLTKNTVSLETPKGLEILAEGLKNTEFEFNSQIGAKTANALLKWIREQDTTSNGKVATAKVTETIKSAIAKDSTQGAIASYEEFKSVALDVYDQLNRDYNLDDLVPIYRIRREIGDRVSRSQFSEWLLEMQANDIIQLMAGEMSGITPDKRDDSISIPGGGLRYYVKRLNS
ncbi:MAG: hypothetical protein U7123_22165, partial [Potamolinea sp.]